MGKLQITEGKSLLVSNSGDPATDGIYILQKTLINNRRFYIKDNTSPTVDCAIAWSTGDNAWILYLIGLPFTLANSNDPSANPWESTWDNNMIVNPIILTNNKISINKQNLGGGKLIAKPFSPKDFIDLQLWLKADAGVTTSTLTPSFIGQIVISGAGVSTSNGTYTRSAGGNTSFFSGANEIYRDGSDWVLYDDDYGDLTYINYDDLDPDSWGEYNAIGAPSAVNTTSSGTPYTGVTSWADQSGNSRNFTNSINNTKAPTFSNGALLFTSSATYNDINASILALPSSSLNFTTPYTLIALVRAGANNSCVFSKSNDNPKRRKYQISVNGGIVYSLESINGADTQISYNTGTGDDVSVKRLIVSQYSSNTSGLLRYNGNQVATSSTNVGIDQTNNASVFIGASPFQEGTGYNAEASTEMYVYEIIFYNRALSTVEIQQIENYLNKKYSIY